MQVLAAKSQFTKLPESEPQDSFVVHYVNNFNVSTILELKQRKKKATHNKWPQESRLRIVKAYFRKKISKVPAGIINTYFPWLIRSRLTIRTMLGGWSPDVVYCSCLPFSAAVLGVWAKREFNVPLVIEFRDLWHGNPYSNLPGFAIRISAIIERHYVQNCDHLVTVSAPLKYSLQGRYPEIPCDVILTGFDHLQSHLRIGEIKSRDKKLKIYYGGSIYAGKRSPERLFEALSRCSRDVAEQVEIIFAGDGFDHVRNMAVQSDLSSHVQFCGRVSYRESLLLSSSADLGLVLTWNSQLDKGSIPGKIFDFIATQTPIIHLGCESGAAATLITQYRLGWVVGDVATMRDLLVQWVEEKQSSGNITFKFDGAIEILSSEKQFERIESICFSARKSSDVK